MKAWFSARLRGEWILRGLALGLLLFGGRLLYASLQPQASGLGAPRGV